MVVLKRREPMSSRRPLLLNVPLVDLISFFEVAIFYHFFESLIVLFRGIIGQGGRRSFSSAPLPLCCSVL